MSNLVIKSSSACVRAPTSVSVPKWPVVMTIFDFSVHFFTRLPRTQKNRAIHVLGISLRVSVGLILRRLLEFSELTGLPAVGDDALRQLSLEEGSKLLRSQALEGNNEGNNYGIRSNM